MLKFLLNWTYMYGFGNLNITCIVQIVAKWYLSWDIVPDW